MKKSVFLLILWITFTFVLAISSPQSVPIYKFVTPTGWVEETNTVIADATATNEWTTQDDPNHVMYNSTPYIVLPATPDYYQVPQINWEVDISQWIYIYIEYLEFNMHVDMPGDYAIDNLDITVKTNGGINVYFNTGGDLNDGNGGTIPTWLGYLKNSDQAILPQLGGSNAFFAWVRIGDLPGESNFITILSPCGTIMPCEMGEETYKIWFGFRVANDTCKGNYSTYVDVYIQSDP